MSEMKNEACEECETTMNVKYNGRFTVYFCPVCHENVDVESFMAEHFSEEE